MTTFSLFLTDGERRIPLGSVECASFMTAAKAAVVQYAGTFKPLDLPCWHIQSTTGESIAVAALRPPKRAKAKERAKPLTLL